MPTLDDQPSAFRDAWLMFVDNAKPFLVPIPEDRGLDQFLVFRDKTIAIVADEHFVRTLASRLQDLQRSPPTNDFVMLDPKQFDALLEEIRACSRAAEVVRATTTSGSSEDTSKARKTHLSRLSITLGSLKDVLSDTPWLKTGIGLFKELVDFFR